MQTNVHDNQEGVRMYFEKFAKDRHFDPLIASNWYQISRQQVAEVLYKIQTFMKHD